jgi:hypothetical protein
MLEETTYFEEYLNIGILRSKNLGRDKNSLAVINGCYKRGWEHPSWWNPGSSEKNRNQQES